MCVGGGSYGNSFGANQYAAGASFGANNGMSGMGSCGSNDLYSSAASYAQPAAFNSLSSVQASSFNFNNVAASYQPHASAGFGLNNNGCGNVMDIKFTYLSILYN